MTSRLGKILSTAQARLDDGGFRRLAHSLDRGASLGRTLKQRFLNATGNHPLSDADAYIIFPSPPRAGGAARLSECALMLSERIRALSRTVCGGPAQFLSLGPQARLVRSFDDGEILHLDELFSRHPTILLANTSFLLTALPPVAELLEAARGGALAVRADDSSRSLYAVALTQQVAPFIDLEAAIAHLACCAETKELPRWADRPRVKLIQSSDGSAENSPAIAGLKDKISRPPPIAPVYLNAALAELFYEPADAGPADGSLERLRQAFLAQRERSAVPWVFNMLTNEIEYRMGMPTLDSLPPEIHLSLTGRCNIECKFCHYAHERAYNDYVTVERIAALDALRYAHTLRLSSGIGEPTLNPHLKEIVEYLAATFPQLQLNFFTNGTALNRRGLTDALVYNTAWINVSLNAATRSTWRELCEKDMFEQLCSNLKELHRAKRERGAVQPVVYGSMVLNSKNVPELPRMPELCRALGIDRFTAIPFFSLGYDYADRYGTAETFHHCRHIYDALYDETLREARRHRVSVELPMPSSRRRVAFGLETRGFYDFAGIEETPGRLSALIDDAGWVPDATGNCHHIWRTAYIGSTDRTQALPNAHYLYPCLGPLARVDFSTRTTFNFPDLRGFRETWNSPVLVRLRAAQTRAGLSRVCEACRHTDSRDPENFAPIQELLKEWQVADTMPLVQLTRSKPSA
jgi:MoaA/NifB/PqqE/SkfB family radical SAM enzyme